MDRRTTRNCPPRRNPGLRALGWCVAGLLWLGLNAAEASAINDVPPSLPPAAPANDPSIQAPAEEVRHLPPIAPDANAAPVPDAPPSRAGQAAPAPAAKTTDLPPPTPLATGSPAGSPMVPIGLDTVLRLAEAQNPQIAIARARVREAYAEKDVARTKWLPDIYIGTAFYRHEGGIQNEDGTLTHSSTGALFAGGELDGRFDVREIAYQQVNAQRQVWQQKGDLSRITSQTLLDASTTYIDWLTARSGEVVAQGLQQDLSDLLTRAQKLTTVEPGAEVDVRRIEAELDAQKQTALKLQQQANAAMAKLIYLLSLDPSAQLLPIDSRLLPFELIDATPPTPALVAQALTTGPGIQEMQGLLGLIQQSIERAQGPGQYLPIFEIRMAEGAFGAGPGDDWQWDNRWDLAFQARWNLTELASLRDRRLAAEAKIQQAQLAYQDLRGKLTAGVQEARDAILLGREQIDETLQQIRAARQAYDLSNLRVQKNIPGSSAAEVLLAINALARARANYLAVTSAYDKAQLRLMVLLGPAAIHCPTQPAVLQLPKSGESGK